MKIYPIEELTFGKNIDREIIFGLINKYRNTDGFAFLVRRPDDIYIYNSSTPDLMHENDVGSLVFKRGVKDVVLSGKFVESNFLVMDPFQTRQLLQKDKFKCSHFIGYAIAIEPLDRLISASKGIKVSSSHLDSKILLPYSSALKNEYSLRSVKPLIVSLESLYIGITSKNDYRLEETKHALRLNEKIPARVITKVKKLPKINEIEFKRLGYLRDLHEEFWDDYIFKKLTIKRVYSSFEEEAWYEFEEWFPSPKFINRDKPIKAEIKKINRNVERALLKKFKDEGLPKGFALGDKCAEAAAKMIQPSFEFYEGRLKKKYEGYFPVKLWIVFQASKFIWGKVHKKDYSNHPKNKLVSDFFYSLDACVDASKISVEALELRDEFLRIHPEIIYYPSHRFNRLESDFAATLIRPNWAYAINSKLPF